MKIAIVGLPNCGKTTVFNALTGQTVETAAFSSGKLEPNIAAVKVPDPRLQALAQIYKPRKVTVAEVQYVDVGGFKGGDAREKELSPELLSFIGTADALLHVVRAFEHKDVPHPLGSVDPQRDLAQLELELIFSDLLVIERRLDRLQKEIKKFSGQERESRTVECDLLSRLKSNLEEEKPLRLMELTPQEEKLLRGFTFLSMKPCLVVVNLGEDQISQPGPLEELSSTKRRVASLSAKIEAEMAQLDEEDAKEFMESLGIHEPARDRVIALSYALLGLISFLTVGEDEVRAWTIREGTVAVEAGGVIHSDIQRGFIRAEVVPFEDLVKAGNMAAAKKQGRVRLEGKEYVLHDGDVSHFLFNV